MISIVITTHNDSEWLLPCLLTCFQQRTAKEVILVDDHSSKPFPDKVQRFIRNHPVRFIGRESNGGAAAARNTGIAQATHDMVITMDADDFFMPYALDRLHDQVDSDHHIFYANVYDSAPDMKTWVAPKTHISQSVFYDGDPLFASSLFRKSVWQGVGGYTEIPRMEWEDYNFWAKACAAGFQFKYCNVNLYQHTYRKEGKVARLAHRSAELDAEAIQGVFD